MFLNLKTPTNALPLNSCFDLSKASLGIVTDQGKSRSLSQSTICEKKNYH